MSFGLKLVKDCSDVFFSLGIFQLQGTKTLSKSCPNTQKGFLQGFCSFI